MGAGLRNAFRKAVEKAALSYPGVVAPGQLAADLFQTMNAERSDIVHAYAITNLEGEQILHRRKDSQGKYFEVTDVLLDSQLTLARGKSAALRHTQNREA